MRRVENHFDAIVNSAIYVQTKSSRVCNTWPFIASRDNDKTFISNAQRWRCVFIRIYRTSEIINVRFHPLSKGATKILWKSNNVKDVRHDEHDDDGEGESREEKCAISLTAFWLLRISHVASVRGKQSSTKELYRIRRQLSSDMTRFTRRCTDFKVSRQPSCYYKRKFDSIVTNTIRYV